MSDERFKKIPKGALVLGGVVGSVSFLSILAAILGSLSSGDAERGKPILLEMPNGAPEQTTKPLNEPAKIAQSRREAWDKVVAECDAGLKETIDQLKAEVAAGRAYAFQMDALNKSRIKKTPVFSEAIGNFAAQAAILQKLGNFDGQIPLTPENTQKLINSVSAVGHSGLALAQVGTPPIPSVNAGQVKKQIDACASAAVIYNEFNPNLGKQPEGVPAQLRELPQQQPTEQQEQTDGDISGGGDDDGSY